MARQKPLDISLRSLMGWVLGPVLGMTLFGIWPTWLLEGWAGVIAQWVTVLLVLSVMFGSGSLTVYAARQGAGPASTVFLGASLFRMLLSPLLVGLAWLVTGLPSGSMTVWLVITYVTCLVLECIWLVLALRRAELARERSHAQEPATPKESPDSAGPKEDPPTTQTHEDH